MDGFLSFFQNTGNLALHYLLPFVIVLGIMVFFHELGHFVVAKFFDVKMGLFFEDEEGEVKFEVVRRTERREVSRVISKAGTGHGYTYEALSFRKRNKKMEPFLVTVSERPEEETLYNHEGEEFLLILKGRAEILLEQERITLEEGDAVYFDASLRHRLLSCDGEEVQVLAVVTR